MAAAEEFLSSHLGQLISIGFPEDLIPNLYNKLVPSPVFDAGNVFFFADKNDGGCPGNYALVAKTDLKKHSDVFIVDHAWTNDGGVIAKQQLEKMPQLLSRMQNIFGLTKMDDTVEEDEHFCKSEDVIREMCSCSLEEAKLALKSTNYCIVDSINFVLSKDKTANSFSMEEDTQCTYEEFKQAMSSCAPEISATNISENYMEKLYASFLKQNGTGLGAGMTSKYNWTDNLEDGLVYVYVAIKPDTKKHQIKSHLCAKHWKLEVVDMEIMIDGDLFNKVIPDESWWSIESPGLLCMALRKNTITQELWTELIKGEKQLSPKEIEEVVWKNEMKKAIEITEVLDAMWLYNQTYSIGSSSDNIKQQAPKWYLMDEVGCAMEHSIEPNFFCLPFFFLNKGLAFNLIWPIRDIQEGERITRNFLSNNLHGEMKENYDIRAFMLTSNGEFHPKLSPEDNHERMPMKELSFVSAGVAHVLHPQKKLFCDYIDIEHLQRIASKLDCTIADEMADADILLLSKPVLEEKLGSNAYVNHFLGEEQIYLKDQLANFIQEHIGFTSWFPRTFLLRRDLNQMMEKVPTKNVNGYWIVRIADSSKAEFEPTVTRDFLRICRLAEVGITVASEFSTTSPLFKGKKFALSYTAIFFKADKSPGMYIHKCPYIRTAKKKFDTSKLFDEYDTSSLLTKKPTKPFDKNRQEEIEEFIEAMSAVAKKNNLPCSWKDIEKSIFSCIGEILNAVKQAFSSYKNVSSFALLGIEFVLDLNLQPLLVGIDSVPTFASEAVLTEMLSTVINVTARNDLPPGDSLIYIESS